MAVGREPALSGRRLPRMPPRTSDRGRPRLRKRLLGAPAAASAGAAGEIDIVRSATVAYSSERPTDPVEHLFDGSSGPGATRWVGARGDATEEIVVEFDRPQAVSRLLYEVEEREGERTQEVRVEISEDGGQSWRQVLVQEFNFSPRGATFEREDQRLERRQATHLRLLIVPNKNGSGSATLTTLRLFA
jgi:hypothetical protein